MRLAGELRLAALPAKRPSYVRWNILGPLTRDGESRRRCEGRPGWIGRETTRSTAQLPNDAQYMQQDRVV